jgi:hypothetical protein
MSTTRRAFALLYVMLVVASVTAAFAFAASEGSAFAGNRLRADRQQADVRMLAMRCGEVLLMQVRNNTSLTASSTLSYGTGSCAYTVTGTAPAKTISITASQYNLYKRLTITTTQVSPSLQATWTESS